MAIFSLRIWIQTSDPQPDPVRIRIFSVTNKYLFSDVRRTLLSSTEGFEENRRHRFTLKRSWLEELHELGKGASLSVVRFFGDPDWVRIATAGLVRSEIP
jgi:hypothetical protein